MPRVLCAYAATLAHSTPSKGRATRCTWRAASEAHASCEVLVRSILPEPIEAVGAKLGISHRMHDVAVAKVVLQRAGVDAQTASRNELPNFATFAITFPRDQNGPTAP